MSSSQGEASAEGGSTLMGYVTMFGSRLANNTQESFASMTGQQWIRLMVIVCGYLLIRPYLLKAAEKHSIKQLEKQHKQDRAKISANEIRGVQEQLDALEEESAAEEVQIEEAPAVKPKSKDAERGDMAKARQRLVMKKLLEAGERKRGGDSSDDEDVSDLLT